MGLRYLVFVAEFEVVSRNPEAPRDGPRAPSEEIFFTLEQYSCLMCPLFFGVSST